MSVPSFLSAIVVTHGRPDELDGVLANLLNQDRQPEEIIVVDTDPSGVGRGAPHVSDPLIRYLCPGEEMGLVHARNLAASKARGDILLFMHDYVRFDKYHVTNTVMNAFRPQEIGALTFYVRNASSRELVLSEYPGKRADQFDKPREVSNISPCCFAVRRNIFTDLAGFDENLFDGEECLDLAVRVLKAGWQVRYTPMVVVELRASMRTPNFAPTGYRLVRNHIYYALKHLPYPFVGTQTLVWAFRGLYAAIREKDLADWLDGFKAIKGEGLLASAQAYRVEHPTTKANLDYLLAHEGQVMM